MAASKLNEPMNCFRTSKLLVEGGGYFARELLKEKAIRGNTNTVDTFLANQRTKIDKLKQRNILHDSQYNKLFPPNNTPTDITTWDITLTTCMLKNCLVLTKLEKDAIDDIRTLRNTLYGHVTTLAMTEDEFKTSWQQVSNTLNTAAQLLSSRCQNHISEMIKRLLKEDLSPKESIELLKEWVKMENYTSKKLDEIKSQMKETDSTVNDIKITVKDAIVQREQIDQKELNRQIQLAKIKIKSHKESTETNNLSNQTRLKTSTDQLRKNNIIILTGLPGSGKTFLAYSILDQIVDNDKSIAPLIMNDPRKILDILDISKPLVLLVDDILGKFSVDNTELNEWNQYLDQILSFTKTQNLMVIITVRNNIKLKCRNDNVAKYFEKEEYVFDLATHPLTEKEKIEVLTMHARRTKATDCTEDIIKTVVSQETHGIGFPFLCTLVKDGNILDLFTRHAEYVKEEMLVMKNKDTACFVALLMTLFCDGKMYHTCLDEHQNACFEKICDHFKSSGIDKAKLFDAANSLLNTFLLDYNDGYFHFYSFIHDTIAETTLLAAKECIADRLIQLCPIQMFTKYMLAPESKEKSNVESIKTNLPFQMLAKRFKSEIKVYSNKSAMQCIGSSPFWKDVTFCKIASQILDPIDFFTEDDDNKSLLCYLSCSGYEYITQNVTDMDTSVVPKEQVAKQLYQSIKETCRFGKLACFEILISFISDIPDELMFAAANGGNCKILEELNERGGNIRARKYQTQENLLHVTCARGDNEMTNRILTKCSQPMKDELLSSLDVDQKTPLLHAAMRGNEELMKLLLVYHANIESNDKDGFNCLHTAAMFGNIEILRFICLNHDHMLLTRSTKGYTAAHSATAGGIKCLKYLLENGLDPSDVTEDGGTLLHEASINGNIQVVKYLSETYKEMIPLLDNDEETACHYAARGGHVHCLATLVSHGVNPLSKTKKGYTPLHEAAYCGKIEVVMYLCDKVPKLLDMLDVNGQTAGHHAAAGGHLECLTYLLNGRIDPWKTSEKGFTLLHEASHCGKIDVVKFLCKKFYKMLKIKSNYAGNAGHSAAAGGHIDCLKYLLDQGIDVLEKTSTGYNILTSACIYGHQEIVAFLCNKYKELIHEVDNDGGTIAFAASSGGNVECLEIVIENGVDPYSKRSDGGTILHSASRRGNLEAVIYICENYKTLIDKTCKGKTAAVFAAGQDHVECLKYFLKNGTNVTKKYGQTTLLHFAAFSGSMNVIEFLCDKCKNTLTDDRYKEMLNDGNKKGETAMHMLATKGNLEALKYLLAEGADQTKRTQRGLTLFHTACEEGNVDVVRFLCEKYPEMIPLLIARSGQNAAFLAAAKGHLDCLRVLFDRGLDPMYMTRSNKTVFHVAVETGQTETLRYLCKENTELVNKFGKSAMEYARNRGFIGCERIIQSCFTTFH